MNHENEFLFRTLDYHISGTRSYQYPPLNPITPPNPITPRQGSLTRETGKSRLTEAYGKGFTKTNLYSFAKFYEFFPEIFHSVSGKCGQLLSWTYYRVVVQELNADARKWYVHEALSQNWSVRTLQPFGFSVDDDIFLKCEYFTWQIIIISVK